MKKKGDASKVARNVLTAKALEILVAQIEQVLGSNIKVISPDRIPDRVTGVLREVDVSVRSKLGTTEILLIFECRKRGRRADCTWIEQLASKGRDIGANKVVAVTTGGHSRAALAKATAYGIELRELRTIAPAELRGWANFRGLINMINRYVVKSCKFSLSSREENPNKYTALTLSSADQIFVDPRGVKHSIDSLVALWMQSDGSAMLDSLFPFAPEVEATERVAHQVKIEIGDGPLVLSCQDRDYDFDRMVVDIDMWREQKLYGLDCADMRNYLAHGGQSIAQAVTFDLPGPHVNGTLTFVSGADDMMRVVARFGPEAKASG